MYLQCILSGLEGYLCPAWDILIYPRLSFVLFCDNLRVIEGYAVNLEAILRHPGAILRHPGATFGGLESDLGTPGAHLWTS